MNKWIIQGNKLIFFDIIIWIFILFLHNLWIISIQAYHYSMHNMFGKIRAKHWIFSKKFRFCASSNFGKSRIIFKYNFISPKNGHYLVFYPAVLIFQKIVINFWLFIWLSSNSWKELILTGGWRDIILWKRGLRKLAYPIDSLNLWLLL